MSVTAWRKRIWIISKCSSCYCKNVFFLLNRMELLNGFGGMQSSESQLQDIHCDCITKFQHVIHCNRNGKRFNCSPKKGEQTFGWWENCTFQKSEIVRAVCVCVRVCEKKKHILANGNDIHFVVNFMTALFIPIFK